MPQIFAPIDVEMLIQIGFSLALSGAVGLEREARGRAAGLRTMMLVCLGSTMVMIVSGAIVGVGSHGHDPAVTRVDPARIAAGVVTGIGFLGAAVVVRLGDLIRGVTTAATIWFAAALGIVIGAKQYTLALWATIAALAVLWLFQFLERAVPGPIYRKVTLRVRDASCERTHQTVLAQFRRQKIRVMDLNVEIHPDQMPQELIYHVRTRRHLPALDIARGLLEIDGIEGVRWDA